MIKELNWMLIFFPREGNLCQTTSRVSVNECWDIMRCVKRSSEQDTLPSQCDQWGALWYSCVSVMCYNAVFLTHHSGEARVAHSYIRFSTAPRDWSGIFAHWQFLERPSGHLGYFCKIMLLRSHSIHMNFNLQRLSEAAS